MSDDQFLRDLLTGDPKARPAFRAELRAHLSDEWHGRATVAPVVAAPVVDAPGNRAWWTIGTAAAVVALVVAGLAWVTRRDDPATPPVDTSPATTVVPDTTTPSPTVGPDTTASGLPVLPVQGTAATVTNGWVAFETSESDDRNISLVRPGEDPHRLQVAGSDSADGACPAWSPDGARLLFGRLTGSSDTTPGDAELVIVPVGPDGATGTPTVIALDGFDSLDGFDDHPCGTWSPDGRWVALRGPGEVWVVDTQTGEIRRLPDLRPLDLEWRPGTDEFAIAGDMGMTRAADWSSTPVSIYSVSTGDLRPLGSVEADSITWSPDGSTLAYSGQENGPSLLWLVDADGANARLLADMGQGAMQGIGPVWSPTGERIVYNRGIGFGERSEVVLVSVADGSETVIEPPEADGPGEGVRWYPYHVSWSPDGATLLWQAWRVGQPAGEEDGRAHLIAIPADTPNDVTVLAPGGVGAYTDHRWTATQMWGRQSG